MNKTSNKLRKHINKKQWSEALDRCHKQPNEARSSNNLGELPLHDACRNNAPLEVIRVLHKVYPQGITTANRYGKLPIHSACRKNASLEVIQFLHEANPKGVTVQNSSGYLPIHDACWKGAPLEVAEYLYKAYPEGVKITNSSGFLPVHSACWKSAPLEVIKFLIKVHSPGLKYQRKQGHLPIHDACLGGASLELITYLHESYSHGTETTNELGELPIHDACLGKSSLDVIQYLTNAFPPGIQRRDNSGNLPIHNACWFGKPLEVMKFLHASYPAGTYLENHCGETPMSIVLNSETKYSESQKMEFMAFVNEAVEEPEGHADRGFCFTGTEVEDPYSSDREKINKFLTDLPEKMHPPQQLSKEYIGMCTTQHKVGEGVFGEVFLGIDDNFPGVKFAIKRLRYEIRLEGETMEVQTARKTMEKELKTLNTFQHPHIARLYGYHLSHDLRGEQLLVYELASRGSLDKFFETSQKRLQIPWERRILIAQDVASALAFLHEGEKDRKCFHRDVKSANICLRKDYSAVLVDCGLAKLMPMDDEKYEGVSLSTVTEGRPGTLPYMCPIYARSGKFDAKSEVYSFGIVVLELLTGALQKKYPESFYDKYIDNTMGGAGDSRLLLQDIDGDAGPWNKVALQKFSVMALKCIAMNPRDRPSMRAVLNFLVEISEEFCYI